MFVDEVSIEVTAGKGGNGALSFRREKFVPHGGPDGGDGGHGGSVELIADTSVHTLLDFRYRKFRKASSGGHGEGGKRRGKNGRDLIIPIPVGTVIKDEQGVILADLVHPGQRVRVARGGKGGRGNRAFANSQNRTPRFAEKGEPGESRRIYLELKLLADVGIVGLPNAGKSTLLASISAARPQIADYEFTTLVPQLGMVEYGDNSFVAADLPGIIEGASQGAGLGFRFLKHCERTSLLLHLVDVSSWNSEDPITALEKIDRELAGFSTSLANKPRLVVANKIDLENAPQELTRLQEALSRDERVVGPVMGISAATGQGVQEMLEQLSSLVNMYGKEKASSVEEVEEIWEPFAAEEDETISVTREKDAYRVKGRPVERLVARTDFSNHEAVQRFWRLYRKTGVEEMLLEQGIKPGDTVKIGKEEFTYHPDEEIE